jgi:CRP/FNR family transcriptional regulator, cyclic AMP receptor protein
MFHPGYSTAVAHRDGDESKYSTARRSITDQGYPTGKSTQAQHFTEMLHSSITANLHSATTLRLDRNTNIYNAGSSRERNIYLVEVGQVKTVVFTRSGKRCILDVYGKGDVFGELCLLSRERMETAITMQPSVLLSISMDKARDSFGNEFWRIFAHYLTNQLLTLQDIVADFVTMESENRLAAHLLRLSRRLGQVHPRGRLITARITQEELAEMIGTTRSRVGCFLKRFREIGLIELDHQNRLIVKERPLSKFLSGLT